MKSSQQERRSSVWRISAVLLLLFFCAPLVAPFAALSEGVDSSLPACCRTHGKHQCSMKIVALREATQSNSQDNFKTLSERCPYTPASLATVHEHLFRPEFQAFSFPDFFEHSVDRAQSEGKRHLAFDRSRQTRGPPTRFLFA